MKRHRRDFAAHLKRWIPFCSVVAAVSLAGPVGVEAQGQTVRWSTGDSLSKAFGVPCEVRIESSAPVAGAALEQAKKDVEAVRQAFWTAALKSKDMQTKVKEACKAFGGIFKIVIFRNQSGMDTAGVGTEPGDPQTNTNQVQIDMSDVEATTAGTYYLDGSPAAQATLSAAFLTTVLAHEIDHLADGPKGNAHDDPQGADCMPLPPNPADAQNKPLKDENMVASQLKLGVAREFYGRTEGGLAVVRYRVGDQSVGINYTGIHNKDQPQGPSQAGPQQRHAASVDGIPGAPCGGQQAPCYRLPLETDGDLDGVLDGADNCPLVPNSQQGDANGNGTGDDCEPGEGLCAVPWAAGAGGLSRKTRIAIGAGAGVVLVGVLAAGGGSDSTAGSTPSSPPPQQPTAPATPAPVLPPGLLPFGFYSIDVTVAEDGARHDPSIGLGSVDRIEVSGTGTAVAFGGPAPWVTVSGSWDPSNGRFSATGRGRVAGNQNVRCNFDGTLTPSGQIEGSYVMGAGGGLPGNQPIVYRIVGGRNTAR